MLNAFTKFTYLKKWLEREGSVMELLTAAIVIGTLTLVIVVIAAAAIEVRR